MRTVLPDPFHGVPHPRATRPAFAAWRLALYLAVAALLLNFMF